MSFDQRLPYEEDELVALLKQRNVRAFEQLYEKYAAALYSVIFQIVGGEPRANEVLKKAFVTAWHNIDGYDPSKSRLFTWILNVARQTAIAEARTSSGSHESAQSYPAKDLTELSRRRAFDGSGLKKALDKLGEDEKLLIELCYYKGLTHEQIAEKMDIAEGNLKTRIKTALTQLRTLL
jgi:RNA polymerase sigma factor (sigma-70 family)